MFAQLAFETLGELAERLAFALALVERFALLLEGLGNALCALLTSRFGGFFQRFFRFVAVRLLFAIGQLGHLFVELDEIAFPESLRCVFGQLAVCELAHGRIQTRSVLLIAELQALGGHIVSELGDACLGFTFFHALGEIGAELLCVARDLLQALALLGILGIQGFEAFDLLQAAEVGDRHHLRAGRRRWGRGRRGERNQAQVHHGSGAEGAEPVEDLEDSRTRLLLVTTVESARRIANDHLASGIRSLHLLT